MEFRKLLGRLVDVCQAIQYAHDRGVLHRDLKPGNIMLGKSAVVSRLHPSAFSTGDDDIFGAFTTCP